MGKIKVHETVDLRVRFSGFTPDNIPVNFLSTPSTLTGYLSAEELALRKPKHPMPTSTKPANSSSTSLHEMLTLIKNGLPLKNAAMGALIFILLLLFVGIASIRNKKSRSKLLDKLTQELNDA